MEETERARSSQKAFKILFFAIFIDLLGFGIIIPILPFLVKTIDPVREGILLATLLTAYSLAQFIFAPLWGRMSDRVGRRPIILIGLSGSVFGFALFGFVNTYPLFILSRVLAGIFTGASLPTARAYIADITPPKERARRFGFLGAAFGMGFTFGPALGSLFSLDIFLIPGLPTHATPSLIAALFALTNSILAFKRLPESLHFKKQETSKLKRSTSRYLEIKNFFSLGGISIIFLIFGVTTLIFSGFEAMFPLFANYIDNRIDEENIGYFFALIGILIAIFQSSIVGPIVNRFGEEKTILIGLTFEVIGFFLISVSSSIFTLVVFVIPLGIGVALVNPTINSAVSNRIPKDQQGVGLGINSSIGSLGRVIGPIYGGFLYDKIRETAPFQIGGLLILILFVVSNKLLNTKTIHNQV